MFARSFIPGDRDFQVHVCSDGRRRQRINIDPSLIQNPGIPSSLFNTTCFSMTSMAATPSFPRHRPPGWQPRTLVCHGPDPGSKTGICEKRAKVPCEKCFLTPVCLIPSRSSTWTTQLGV